MVKNNHTFHPGEEFNGTTDNETIFIRSVRDHTIVWDHIVDGKTLGRRTMEKAKARTLIRCGSWSQPLTEH